MIPKPTEITVPTTSMGSVFNSGCLISSHTGRDQATASEHAADAGGRHRDLGGTGDHLGGDCSLAAKHWLDATNLWTALGFYAMPTQWIGLLVIFYIAIPLGLPVAGIQSNTLGILGPTSLWTTISDKGEHLALPALVLGLGLYGEYALVVRSSMLETLGEDYILTARAKGLKNSLIVWRHAFRNAMLPLVTLIALSLGYVVAGQIVVEYVFSYPGIGLATVDAIDPTITRFCRGSSCSSRSS